MNGGRTLLRLTSDVRAQPEIVGCKYNLANIAENRVEDLDQSTEPSGVPETAVTGVEPLIDARMPFWLLSLSSWRMAILTEPLATYVITAVSLRQISITSIS